MSVSLPPDPLDAIPDAQQIRERLAENLREARILRQMLRLALKAEKERQQRTGMRPRQQMQGATDAG